MYRVLFFNTTKKTMINVEEILQKGETFRLEAKKAGGV
jgi:hypothetical protein